MFLFEEFLKKWEFNKSMEKFLQFLNFVSYKYNLSFDDISNDFKDRQRFIGFQRVASISFEFHCFDTIY